MFLNTVSVFCIVMGAWKTTEVDRAAWYETKRSVSVQKLGADPEANKNTANSRLCKE